MSEERRLMKIDYIIIICSLMDYILHLHHHFITVMFDLVSLEAINK